MSIVIEENKCDCCKRSDVTEVAEYNVSYNHCWIWYKSFDTENGFKAIYDMTIDEAIPKMEKMKADIIKINGGVPTHKMNEDGSIAWSEKQIENREGNFQKDDGWAVTNFNAYRVVDEMIEISKRVAEEHPKAMWSGD
jgi:hypothetical protein